ncbi:hypothetical protein NQ317_007697 [Molorchus minor]|uniref:Uncharacterized protein n=1 Tax=Molorchus minor TaxID=1323400 RepID=A0ABQ9JQ17_9CUCU|nr:hypothetical protein NQ317_007697 [Molorchus minor]
MGESTIPSSKRETRLTASNCGTVIKRRSSTKPDNLVKTIMGINYAQSEAINYDKIKESVALQRFAASRPQAKIQKSGIFIDETYGYLAAFPDGKWVHKKLHYNKQIYFKFEIDRCLPKRSNS